jgi:prophage antirepressor-like protein
MTTQSNVFKITPESTPGKIVTQDKTRKMQPLLYGIEAVRIITDDQGETWWVAKDVLDILDLDHITNALKGLDEDELTVIKLQSGGQKREMKIINESGLYTLILRSNKPEAKPFRKWVTKEVLPQIRKTGAYGISNQTALPVVLDHIRSLEKKIDQFRVNSNIYGPVWTFALTYCDVDMRYVAAKDDLYSAYMEHCRANRVHTECKSHFFMKLYHAVPSIYPSAIMMHGAKVRVVRGLGLKNNYRNLLLEKGGAA